MVRNAHAQAVQLDIQVTAVVVDQSGRMIALGRMDRARPITVDIALNKAYTAASFQQPTKDLAGVAGQTWFQSLVVSSSGRIMPGGGALPSSRAAASSAPSPWPGAPKNRISAAPRSPWHPTLPSARHVREKAAAHQVLCYDS